MTLTPEMLAYLGFGITGLVAAIVFVYGLVVRRPKIIGMGSGTSGVHVPNKDVMASRLTFSNLATVFGLKVGRETAVGVSAYIEDPLAGETVGSSLRWEVPGSRDLSIQTSIESGRQASLFVFAKERYSKEYFVFNFESQDSELPKHIETLDDKDRRLNIVLTDQYGKRYRFAFRAVNQNQSVSLRFETTLRHRLRLIWTGLTFIAAAFKRNRY